MLLLVAAGSLLLFLSVKDRVGKKGCTSYILIVGILGRCSSNHLVCKDYGSRRFLGLTPAVAIYNLRPRQNLVRAQNLAMKLVSSVVVAAFGAVGVAAFAPCAQLRAQCVTAAPMCSMNAGNFGRTGGFNRGPSSVIRNLFTGNKSGCVQDSEQCVRSL